MRRVLAIIICIILLAGFSGCEKNVNINKDKLQIVATVFPLYDFARQIAGDKAEVTLLLKPGGEAHSYEPTIQDIMKIKQCDIFLTLGKDAEPWTQAVIGEMKEENVFSAMNCVTLEKEQEHDHRDIHESVTYDEHIWTSLKNAVKILQEIFDTLSEKDSSNAQYYKENTDRYIEKISQLDEKFEELTAEAEKKTIVFADRFPFRYFAKDYSLSYFAAYPGCSAESEPSVTDVSKLIDIVKEENTSVVFYTETSNKKLPATVCEETGAKMRLFHSCHTLNNKELEKGTTYLDIMNENYEALCEALE